MTTSLHYNTVSPFLLEVLKLIMRSKIFDKFRLVGGTSLSLQRGHRMSLDIDLFTNAEYGSIDFNGITRFLQKHFLYVDSIKLKPEGLGKAFFADNDFDPVCLKSKYWEVIKLDMMDFVNDYLSR